MPLGRAAHGDPAAHDDATALLEHYPNTRDRSLRSRVLTKMLYSFVAEQLYPI